MNPQQFSPQLSLQFSNYAQQRYAAQPALLEQLDYSQAWSVQRMQQRLNALLDLTNTPIDRIEETQLSQALRQLRQEVMLTVIERDLAGRADLNEVTHSMTWLAECTVHTALHWASQQFAERHGIPQDGQQQPVDLLVIGMGKLGGGELNVSSDIDLIFAYAEDGTTHGTDKPISNHEFFERVGRKLIALLSEATAYGMVFRVDMRLRPYGDSGPLVCSLSGLENYLISQGREWERYAWLKARVISQAVFLAEQPALWNSSLRQLEQLIRPFVYRRYLDFGAIEALRDLHGKIKQELGRRDHQHSELRNGKTQGNATPTSTNIKLGRGGIREIEFITQVFQLIRGGRDETLRERSTQFALTLCAARGYLDQESATKLLAAYRFLRRLEHCLQYRDDAQTHALPDDLEQQAIFAAMMGMPIEIWRATLAQHRSFVMQQFDQVFGAKLNYTPSETAQTLENLPANFDTELTGQMYAQIEQVRNGSKYLALPESHRQRFESLLHTAIQLCAAHPQPLVTLRRVLDLLETIARRGAYLSLLSEFPPAFERVVRLLSSSSWAATYLIRHPLLLDELVDIRDLYTPPDLAQFETLLRQQLVQHADDAERQMNLMREAHHAQVFRLLLQDIEGVLSIEKLADYLSELADRILQISLEQVWTLLRHAKDTAGTWPSQPRFAIIAYGKLGGKELGYASDLDLIFLYAEEEGEDAPDVQERYARLAQRLTSWLSSQTTSGLLFEIDLRLRPNGNAGLLVSSLPAFVRYQQEAAWAWEHQALTRARFCAGDAHIGQAFETARRSILQQPRDIPKLTQEVLAMREKMHAGHPNPDTLFDIKHDSGGMVDIEFAVQYLVLAHSAKIPELTRNLGNIALLKLCAENQLLPPIIAESAANAYRHLRALQHQLRLDGAPFARVDAHTVTEDRAAVIALWKTLFGNSTDTSTDAVK